MSRRPIPPRPSLELDRKQAKALLFWIWALTPTRGDAVRLLIGRGADVHAVNRFGGDALDTTAHGSVNCHDALGGITTKLADEITHGDYPAITDMLIGAGASLPGRLGGSEAVQDVLRRAGVPDPE